MAAVANVKQGKRDVIEFDLTEFQHTPLGKFVIYRLRNNYDVKFIITGDVGEGKTSLGVALARWVRGVSNDVFDEFRKWDVEEHAGLDVMRYLKAYKAAEPGDALVIDELQEAGDKRRVMSNKAVWLSWAWMKLRVRQVVSIGILPTSSVLDDRLIELADVRIHVYNRGEAYPYYLNTVPFAPYNTYHIPFRLGDYRQVIGWPNLDGDEDYEKLHAMKEDSGVPGIDQNDHYDESDLREHLRSFKKDATKRALDFLGNGGIETQSDLADILGIDPSTVTKYKRELHNGGDNDG